VLEGELYETASLDTGADDYIVKKAPVSMLLLRLHAHLRRRERDLGLAAKAERRAAIGRFTLDRKAKVLLADEKPIKLAQREMQLLEMLGSSPSRVSLPTKFSMLSGEIISAALHRLSLRCFADYDRRWQRMTFLIPSRTFEAEDSGSRHQFASTSSSWHTKHRLFSTCLLSHLAYR
jgi:hypothetical protein